MRHKYKSTRIRVALQLIVGLTTILFVLSLTNTLNAEDVTSHKGRFWNAKPVGCGDTLEYGRFKLTGNLNCEGEDPAITIIGPARLNLNGYTLSGNEPDIKFKNICILIEGDGAWVWNGTVKNCEDGIEIALESDRNRILRVTSHNNRKRGFKIKGDKNLLFNCTATNNWRKGFSIEGEEADDEGADDEKAEDNLLIKCLAMYNGHQGFNIERGDGNKIYDNNAIANCRDGIEIAKKGKDNLVFYNHVEDNGNPETCADFNEDYNPQSYAGIDIEDDCEDNEIKHNYACGNLGCNGEDCTPRERNYWDENCEPTNEWENNTVCPEYTPSPLD